MEVGEGVALEKRTMRKRTDCLLEKVAVSLEEEAELEWEGGAYHDYKKVWHISEKEWVEHCHADLQEVGEGVTAGGLGSHCRQGN